MKTEVLNENQIMRICNRFAFQILENSIDSDVIHIIGIKEKGFDIAKIVERELKSITKKNISLSSIKIDKKNPKDSVLSDSNLNKNVDTIFLIDDVVSYNSLIKYIIKKNNYDDYKIYENITKKSLLGNFFASYKNNNGAKFNICNRFKMSINVITPLFLKEC